MNTKLFGQFLLEKGYVDRHQLLHALKEQRASNMKIGELAVATGALSFGDVDTIHFRQMCDDVPFGEAAVSLGLLTRAQVVELLHRQSANRKLLGQMLLAFGYMDPPHLEEALRLYAGQKAGEEAALKRLFAESASAAVAPTAVSVMGRVFRRTVGSPVSFATLPPRSAVRSRDSIWSQVIAQGDERYILGIQMEEVQACVLAGAVLDMEVNALDELARDAVAEFLNIVTGHVCGNLDGSEVRLHASPPLHQSPAEFLAGAHPDVALRCDAGEIMFTFFVGRPLLGARRRSGETAAGDVRASS